MQRSVFFKLTIETSLGEMNQYSNPNPYFGEMGGLGWKAIEYNPYRYDYEKFNNLILLEDGKVYVTSEIVQAVGKGSIYAGGLVFLPNKRKLFQFSQIDFETWAERLKRIEPRGEKEAKVKQRNIEILHFLNNLLFLVGDHAC